jgi:hypothetical protein
VAARVFDKMNRISQFYVSLIELCENMGNIEVRKTPQAQTFQQVTKGDPSHFEKTIKCS